MLRHSPPWLLLLAVCVFPVSCSEEPSDSGMDSDSGTGGTMSTDLSLDGTGGTGEGGDGGALQSACKTFAGLETCGSDELTAEIRPVNILLVLDKSGSMDNAPSSGSQTTLWDATTQALTTALEDANDAVSFGLQLFPAREEANGCDLPEGDGVDVEIESSVETRESIITTLGRTAPGGGTPTFAALQRAYLYFSAGAGVDLKGDRFVLLATDGGPNCNGTLECPADACTYNIDGIDGCDGGINCCAGASVNAEGCLDDARTLAMIQQLRDIEVDTFVVGLAGTEEYAEQLDAFAEAGGRPRMGTPEKYFKVEASGTATGLAEVLDEITTQLVQTCDIQLTEEPEALNEINVAVNCTAIPNADAPGSSGQGGAGGESNEGSSYWWLDQETSPPTVHLGGDICRQIQETGVERIDIITGCRTLR